MNGKRLAYHGCRLALGGLFLYAGLLKAADVTAFARDIAAYQLLPYSLNYLVAATLPYVEILAGLLLLLDRKVRAASVLLALLTVVFIGAILSGVLRGLQIDCGCFGSGTPTPAWLALLRDGGILVLAHFTFHLRGARQNLLTPGPPATPWISCSSIRRPPSRPIPPWRRRSCSAICAPGPDRRGHRRQSRRLPLASRPGPPGGRGRPGAADGAAPGHAHVPRALALLRSPAAADSFARYRSAVEDLNRALALWGPTGNG